MHHCTNLLKSFVATLCSTGASAVAITTKRQKEYKLQKLKHSKQGNLNKIRTGKITLTIIQQLLPGLKHYQLIEVLGTCRCDNQYGSQNAESQQKLEEKE